ncbi:MAG: hypothetical protein AAFW87_01255 [Pseudomonadota bacterium]
MKTFVLTALMGAALVFALPDMGMAAPQKNDDGSETCNASGPSNSPVAGVCANTMKVNEDMCDGGLSTEPGGGVTCSENRTTYQGMQLKTNSMQLRR